MSRLPHIHEPTSSRDKHIVSADLCASPAMSRAVVDRLSTHARAETAKGRTKHRGNNTMLTAHGVSKLATYMSAQAMKVTKTLMDIERLHALNDLPRGDPDHITEFRHGLDMLALLPELRTRLAEVAGWVSLIIHLTEDVIPNEGFEAYSKAADAAAKAWRARHDSLPPHDPEWLITVAADFLWPQLQGKD